MQIDKLGSVSYVKKRRRNSCENNPDSAISFFSPRELQKWNMIKYLVSCFKILYPTIYLSIFHTSQFGGIVN